MGGIKKRKESDTPIQLEKRRLTVTQPITSNSLQVPEKKIPKKKYKYADQFNLDEEKAMKKERRWEMILYFQYKKDYKKMLEMAVSYYNDNKSDTDFINCLLYAKALILRNRHDKANEILNECFEIMSRIKLSYKDITKNVKTEKKENQLDFFDEQRTITKNTGKSVKMSTWNYFKMVLSAYATLAALYSHIGNQKSSEEVYGIYASIIEKFYGNNSLESGH